MNRLVSLTCAPHQMGGSIRTDDGHLFLTQTDSGRLTWPIPTEITGGGDLQLQALIPGYQDYNGRCVLPPGSTELQWDKDGVLVTEPLELALLGSTLQPIHIEGRSFHRADGSVWPWQMMTGFCDYALWRRGERGQLDDVLGEAQSLKSTGRRVLLQMYYITQFSPADYGEAFYLELPAFVAHLNGYGQIPEMVIYADEQVLHSGWSHFTRTCNALQGTICVVELANEWSKNGVNPMDFPRFVDGLIFSRGSDTSEAPIVQPPGNYATFRERRDLFKCIGRGYKADEACWDFGFDVPFVYNEPIGANEVDQPGRRSANPAIFAALAAQYRAVGAGMTFHSEAGLTSLPLGPVQLACARAFFKE